MFTAIRHDPRAAALTGIPVPNLKVKTFALSASFAAVGGFFLAEYLLIASPDSFSIVPSLYFLLMVVIGGSRSLGGAIVGAAFVTVVPQLMPRYPHQQEILFAVSFLVIVLFIPKGLAGLADSVRRLAIQTWTQLAPRRKSEGRVA
jgi:branched-chain amino acid transport system permease protein